MAQFQRSQALSVGADSPSEPARAGLSSQAGTKTVLYPEAVLHAPMDTQQEPGHYSGINLFRVNCTCGRRGVWYSSESNALQAHERHVERAAEGVR